MSNIIKHEWKFSQKGNLWSIYNAGKNFITGESREEKDKPPYFFTIDSKTGKVIIKNFVYSEKDIFVFSVAASDKYLFLHRLLKTDIPAYQGIIALDIMTGEKIWENSNYEYMFHTDDAVYTKKTDFESFEYQRLDINSGDIIQKYSENDNIKLFEIRKQTIENSYKNENNFPIFNVEYASDKAIEIFNFESDKLNNISNIEFIELDRVVIFTYHKKSGEKYYEIYLCIYEKNNCRKLYKDKIYKQAPYAFPDNFFIMDNFLYYIKEKKEIVAINLNI